MKFRPINFSSVLAVILVLWANTVFGQIVVDKEYSQYSPVEYRLGLPNANAQALWEVKPLDGQTEYTTKTYTDSQGTVYAFWGQPGSYQLEATVVIVDFEAQTFEIKRYYADFKILGTPPEPGPGPGPGPEPPPPGPTPPPPDSSVPNDQFDNLGQRLDGLADQIGLQVDLRNRVAEVFESTATKMTEPGSFVRLEDVKAYIEQELKQLSLDSSWDKLFILAREDAKKREPMSWEQAYNWYRAVAAGFKGSKLSKIAAIWHTPSKIIADNVVVSMPQEVFSTTVLCPTGVCNDR